MMSQAKAPFHSSKKPLTYYSGILKTSLNHRFFGSWVSYNDSDLKPVQTKLLKIIKRSRLASALIKITIKSFANKCTNL